MAEVTNIVLAGIGGQGVLKGSDILAEAAFRAGFDVKKAEIHGMSQRGGSVTSDVRFGDTVLSPMVPEDQADYVVVLNPNEIERNRGRLRDGGQLIDCSVIDEDALPHKKSLNVAMLGILSCRLPISEECWLGAIEASLPAALFETNQAAFALGRRLGG